MDSAATTNRKTSSSSPEAHKSSIELFHIRFKTRLLMALLCLLQLIPKISVAIWNAKHNYSGPTMFWFITVPFAPAMAIILGIEYLIFKKRGLKVLKYSQVIDIILLLLFMADWILLTIDPLEKAGETSPPSFAINYLFAFTPFGWRTLLVTLLVEKWQLKIIAPVTITAICLGYALHYEPGQAYYSLFRAIAQIFNLIFIIYCEDKLKWKITWTNLQQEKWIQVNNFILNNIPEEIMILDLKGEIQFVSDYCKSFMEKFNLSLSTKDFLHKINHLQQQCQNDSTNSVEIQLERIMTDHELLEDPQSSDPRTLEGVLKSFQRKIIEKNIKERQFLVYNGKLQLEESQQEKAIEVKISFVQHFENFYVVLILRDTTQRDLLITLQETNKYKDQLLASVSHELRAPLNGNINLVEAAVNCPDLPDDIKQNLLVPALRSSKFLLHLINDILDMSQIKEKKLRLNFQPGNLKETLKSTAQLIELQAMKKGIEVVLELDPNLPQSFCTDHLRLSQIVLNLLTNAMKFTKQGTVKLIAAPLDPHWVKIIVEDSGIGMSPENMKKLFSDYTHIEFEGRQIMNSAGVGLGLNIASKLAQLLAPQDHQSIDVVSTQNKGSTFSFIIENKDQALLERLDAHIPNDSGWIPEEFTGNIKLMSIPTLKTLGSYSDPVIQIETCYCPKILVVDDNPFNIMAFETILRSLDIKCDATYSGLSAIEKLLAREKKKCGQGCKQYSVIFMDQEMPEMSGSETVQEIRKYQREKLLSHKIKIIGCTAHKSKVEVDRFLEAGLDDCIYKPISITMVKDSLYGFSV